MPLRSDRIIIAQKRGVDPRIDFEPAPPEWVEYPELGVRVRLYERAPDGSLSFPLAKMLKNYATHTSPSDDASFVGLALLRQGVVEVAEPGVAEGAD